MRSLAYRRIDPQAEKTVTLAFSGYWTPHNAGLRIKRTK
jgi:hypothetical protein